jgi:acylphosphatase
MIQVHIFVSGFVQGVGFRRFVRSKARKLGVKGWVRNTSTRQVEAVLQGEEQIIRELIEICKKGSFLSEVQGVVEEPEEITEPFKEFEIKW